MSLEDLPDRRLDGSLQLALEGDWVGALVRGHHATSNTTPASGGLSTYGGRIEPIRLTC